MEFFKYIGHYLRSSTIRRVVEAVPDSIPVLINVKRVDIGSTASYKDSVKRMCWYLQGYMVKGMVLNPSKIMVVVCYVGVDFVTKLQVVKCPVR